MARTRVLESLDDGVLLLTLNRPERKNAFDEILWRETRDALADAQSDDAVRAVIVTGAGDAFSAGQDLGQMAARPDDEPPGFPSFMDRLVGFDKPLLAAVNGLGVGIGLTMLLHCDVVWMAENARPRAPFVPLGVVPEAASSYLLPLRVGQQAAAEILFTADWVDSARAVEIGLAARELAPEQLLPELGRLAARIAQHPIGSLRHTKRLVRACDADAIRAARAREDEAFRERIGSPENVAAIKAFFAKRR